MQKLDLFILSGYFLISLILGLFFHRKNRSAPEFFLAGRSLHWLPVGISIMITAFSAINITAFSGEVFAFGLYALLSLPVFYLVSIPVKRIVIPFFHNLNITSAYEYLEIRFSPGVRRLAGVIFIIWRILWAATVIYVPARILSTITGISLTGLIVLVGGIATLYTFWGGIRAVIWTDVLQFFIMIAGLAGALAFVVFSLPGGISGIFNTAGNANLLKPFMPFDPTIFSLDPRIRISFWSALFGTFVAFMTRYSADQMIVQRYLTTGSIAQAQKGFTLNYLSAIFSILLLAFLGLAMFANFAQPGQFPQNAVLPIHYFTGFVHNLPVGVRGLMLTAIIAASMSSFDSGIHSCSTVLKTDLNIAPFSKITPRMLVILLGFFITLASIFIRNFGSIFEIANKLVNGFGTPLLALFVMGKYSRRSNGFGALYGGIFGVVFSSITIFGIKNLALHYYALVNFAATAGFIRLFSRLGNKIQPLTRRSN